MDIKKIVLFSVVLMIAISSLSIVNAGWFDFGNDDAIDNPITAPNNAKKVQLEQDDTFDRLDINYGEATHIEEVHTTDWSGETKYNYLSMKGSFIVYFDDLPKNAKSTLEKLHDTIFKKSTMVDQTYADEIPYIKDPSNETGGMYFKLFDKDNNTILTKNIFVTPGVIGKDIIEYDRSFNDCYLSLNGELYVNDWENVFNGDFEWYIDVTDNPELLKTVKNADSCEIHMLVFDEGSAGDCYDICIPIEHVDVEENNNYPF